MTTNKPEIKIYEPSEKGVTAMRKASFRNTGLNRYVRLSDFEDLQAECKKLREHLQNLIDQTTPLEPVPGNPMWSRRIQLDEVIAERDQLQVECDALVEALEFYAKGEHFTPYEPDQWDTVSGEPLNFLHHDDGADGSAGFVENGSIAKAALAAHRKGG